MALSNIIIPSFTTLIPVDTRVNNRKVLLLPTVSTNAGQFLMFKDYYGTASNSSFTISTTGTDLIDDINFRYTFSNAFGSMAFVSDGLRSWRTIGLYDGALTPSGLLAFSPTSITGITLWLDAADTSVFTFSSGSNISQWRDKSGRSNNATAGGTPVLTANSLNSRQSVSNGSSRFLGSMSITGTTLTCFAVALTTRGLPLSGSDQRLVSLENTTNVDYGRTDGVIALFNQGGSSTIATWRVSGPLGNNAIVQNTPFMAVSQYNGTNAFLWFNGSAGTLASSASSGTFNITKYGIGDQANPTNEFWNGNLGEIIVYSTFLSTSERQQVEGYLAWKWGLQGSLPANHPYKNAPP